MEKSPSPCKLNHLPSVLFHKAPFHILIHFSLPLSSIHYGDICSIACIIQLHTTTNSWQILHDGYSDASSIKCKHNPLLKCDRSTEAVHLLQPPVPASSAKAWLFSSNCSSSSFSFYPSSIQSRVSAEMAAERLSIG